MGTKERNGAFFLLLQVGWWQQCKRHPLITLQITYLHLPSRFRYEKNPIKHKIFCALFMMIQTQQLLCQLILGIIFMSQISFQGSGYCSELLNLILHYTKSGHDIWVVLYIFCFTSMKKNKAKQSMLWKKFILHHLLNISGKFSAAKSVESRNRNLTNT